MNEEQRADRLAHDLDMRLSQQAYTEQTVPEDRPLLELASTFLDRAPFEPTPEELALLRRRLEYTQAVQSAAPRFFTTLRQVFRPALQSVFWAAILLGIFLLTTQLIPHLLGRPVQPAAGPASATPQPTQPATTAPVPTTTAAGTLQPAFPVQAQVLYGIRVDLREVAAIGDSLRAKFCFPPPTDGNWRLEAVELSANGALLPFYPSSARSVVGEGGFTCQTFTAANPGPPVKGTWNLTARRLVGPRTSAPDCFKINRQLAQDYPGLSITCDSSNQGGGFSVSEPPAYLDEGESYQITRTYFEADVRSGPWIYTIDPADILPVTVTGGPANPVIVPSTCDPKSEFLTGSSPAARLPFGRNPNGIAGGGSLQSGPFAIQIALACDTHLARLNIAGEESTEINGLGILWNITNQGESIAESVTSYSGVWPFVMHSSSGGSLETNSSLQGYAGLQFPANILPDFTQSDVRLRYLAKVHLPDGTIEGAALAFTLQRAPEGYRPVDVAIEPLTDAERQAVGIVPDVPLPFPTLPVPVKQIPAENQSLLDLLDRWQEPFLEKPGWIYLSTRTELPRGNDLYAGLTEYINDDWYRIDAQRLVMTHIHIDHRPDGTPLQQAYSNAGKTVNLTFGGGGGIPTEFMPYPLDLAYAPRAALNSEEPWERVETTLQSRPAIVLYRQEAITGTTHREALDAVTGAWLYTEVVKMQAGDDPATGGSLENRTTLLVAERVDAPPAEALALLDKDFTGYTPPAPYGTPAPQGFDPSRSKLIHHSIPGDDFNAPTFWYGDLYADGYLLGRVNFGGVSGGWCVRSANRIRLAYNFTQIDENGRHTSSLRWFDIRSLDRIHQPAPELVNIGILSWSPAQDVLAVFGCKADQQDCGLYLLDPATDTIKMLLPGVYASWRPIWNPDGSQIAFVDTENPGSQMYVVDIQTGSVIYQGKFDADAWQIPADSPTRTWGASFPRSYEGSNCFETE